MFDGDKRYASLTVDIDTLTDGMSLSDFSGDSLRRIRNISYRKSLPRILALLEKSGIKATFFIVATDGLIGDNKKVIREIAKCGHEIANHSLSHRRDLIDISEHDIIADISDSGKILSDIIGDKICGFRMPGCTVNTKILGILREMGYLYDSSLNSSAIYNLAKMFYRILLGKNKTQIPYQALHSTKALNEPYFPSIDNIYKRANDNTGILEIPITLVPWLSLPFMNYFLLFAGSTITYLLYNATKQKHEFINYVMHDNEFAALNDYQEYRFPFQFSTLHLRKTIKRRELCIQSILQKIESDYSFATLREYAISRKRAKKDTA